MEGREEINPETVRKIEEWAEQHPTPDKKKFFVGSESYTPRDIAREVREGTKIGYEHARMYEENHDR